MPKFCYGKILRLGRKPTDTKKLFPLALIEAVSHAFAVAVFGVDKAESRTDDYKNA